MHQTVSTSTNDESSTQPASAVEPRSPSPSVPFRDYPRLPTRTIGQTVVIGVPDLTEVPQQSLTQHISLELKELTADESARKAVREHAGGDADRARRGWAPSIAQAEEERVMYFPFDDGMLALLAYMDQPGLLSYVGSSQATAEDKVVFYAHCAEGFMTRSRQRTLDLAAMGMEWPQDDTEWFVFGDGDAETANTLAELANEDDPEFVTVIRSSGWSAETKVSILEQYIERVMARTRHRSQVALSLAQASQPCPPSQDFYGPREPLHHLISRMSRLIPLCSVPDRAPNAETSDEGADALQD